MTPRSPRTAAEERAALYARSGGGAALARLERWTRKHPTIPCAHCSARGFYVERRGARRAFEPQDFDEARGDRLVSSCPRCRGLGRVFVSPAEHDAAEARILAGQRARYARARDAIAKARETTPADIDAMARRRIADTQADAAKPGAWLDAIGWLGEVFGVELDKKT